MKQKMKQLMMTLALLLTAVTGAWADETLLLTINSRDNETFTSGSKTFDDKVTVTFSNSVYNNGDEWGWFAGGTASLLTVAGINGYTITSCKFYTDGGIAKTGYTVEGESPSVCLYEDQVFTDDSKIVDIGTYGITKIEVYGAAASSATTVPLTWDATAKTATLTNGMPAGNVTVSVEYFPQATMADGAVTAATDVKATTEDALVTIDKNKLTGVAKLMYYVSTEATAPEYDTEGWTDQVPTAANYTEAGNVNVWYYAVGADDTDPAEIYSDGDICAKALTVTLGAAPLWNAEFDLTNAPEEDKAGKWSTDIPEGGVVKGTEVTVTYTGSKKIIGVKAEKVKVAEGHALTSAKLGEIVCSDGKAYAAADKDILPKGVKAEALVCFVVGNGRGLALALTDEGEMNWKTAQTSCAAHTPAITGGTWKLASQNEWNNMINAAGGFGALRDGFSSVGGTNMQADRYWSSTDDDDRAQDYNFSFGEWDDDDKTWSWYVRACLAF